MRKILNDLEFLLLKFLPPKGEGRVCVLNGSYGLAWTPTKGFTEHLLTTIAKSTCLRKLSGHLIRRHCP